MPRGPEYKIPLRDLQRAADEHDAGFSLRSICRRRWSEWGYSSVGSALEALRRGLRLIDRDVRDRIESCVMSSTVHGNATRQGKAHGTPRALAHRRWQIRRRRIREGLPVRPPATPEELAEAAREQRTAE